MKAYIKKIAYYLPEKIEKNPANRLREKIGIHCRHIAAANETAADLAVKAAERLFQGNDLRNCIDYVLLCTQSPDYILPTTACILQDRLKLSKACGAMDFNLGCSGYIYGLSLAKGLIESGQAEHVLLLTAETYSKHIHPEDDSVKPLFGDAAAATLIEARDAEASGINGIVVGTDGAGYDHLMIPTGGMRKRASCGRENVARDESVHKRSLRHLYMNGPAIAEFALHVAPSTVEKILVKCGLERRDVDYFVFHQANKLMLDFLQKRCDLLGMPFWNEMKEYGNTVSNTIPIALADLLRCEAGRPLQHVMLVGFGVGLSWGGCLVNLSRCS